MYSIDQLVKGAKDFAKSVFGKKQEYQLRFLHEADNCWYVDIPEWPFDHHNLMMVSGADDLCAFLSDDDKSVSVSVIPSEKQQTVEGYTELKQLDSNITGGATYEVINLEGFNSNIWLCPVTLFVLGQYPKYLYIKKV